MTPATGSHRRPSAFLAEMAPSADYVLTRQNGMLRLRKAAQIVLFC